MPTKAEMKRSAKSQPKLRLRQGDQVVIIAGKDKGERGYVAKISPVENKAYVLKDNPENPDAPLPLNAVIKHKKAKFQGEKSDRLRIPSPIHVSNLMLIDPETDQPTRVGKRREGDKLVRYSKKSGKTLKDQSLINKD
jgi:large subunit ribosomal protein L24